MIFITTTQNDALVSRFYGDISPFQDKFMVEFDDLTETRVGIPVEGYKFTRLFFLCLEEQELFYVEKGKSSYFLSKEDYEDLIDSLNDYLNDY